MIIGITGKRGHGKNAVGGLFLDHLRARGVRVRMDSFAAPIKTAAKDWFGFTEEQVNGSIEAKETVDRTWGLTPREVMQKLGTEVARSIHQDVWARAAIARHMRSMAKVTILTDLRFHNEAEWVRKANGVVVYVRRPERLLPKVSEKFAAHASETAIEQIGERADAVVENDLANLYELNGRLEDTLFPWLDRICR